jgi:NADPH-dependent glutamate synthase beta subunit-like oxidoreductase/Pyruvate/2-oxoacid:ferredoxin oxidoreductase delta subunit
MRTREELAREAGCLDLLVSRPGPDGRVAIGPVAEMPLLAFSTGTTDVNLTGGWKSVRPLYQDKRPPCQEGCPAGEDVARYLRAVQRGQYDEGWRLIMEDNPFPSVMGRVCYHPCEVACNRGSYDEPVAIHAVERFLGDHGLAQGLRMEAGASPRRERVAIIGAGPAGLAAAYHLIRRGYGVSVYEAQPEPGGVLRWGIPPYRLPRDILRQEIARLEAMGVKISSDVAVGRDLSWQTLVGYQAILVATGLPRSRQLLNLWDGVEGLYGGLEFLRLIAENAAPRVGRRVAVIGGGNVAIDVARSATRLGATEVSVVCAEPADAIPAHPEEIDEARREGVQFHCGFAVRQPVVIKGRIIALEITRVKFLGREPNGGIRLVPVGGAVPPLVTDTVIQAIGQEADLGFLPMELARDGRLAADGRGRLRETSVFAAGDVLSGPARVVDAIAAGKRAAAGMHRLLGGKSLENADAAFRTVQIGDLNLAYFAPVRRTAIPQVSADARARSMAEVNSGWDATQAGAEAGRCFNCGVCTGCDNCLVFCPDVAIRKNQKPYTYDVLDQYCKGCGICARECPRQAITMVPANP